MGWPFGRSVGREVGHGLFFGHLALSFGIGAECSFYYEIDTPHRLRGMTKVNGNSDH